MRRLAAVLTAPRCAAAAPRVAQRIALAAVAVRYCAGAGGGEGPAGGGEGSAVDVEGFKLNDDVVARHVAAAERWKDCSDRLAAAKEAGGDGDGGGGGDVATLVAEALGLLAELGPEMSPVQCEPLLRLELAQAHYNARRFDEAEAAARAGLAALLAFEGAARDTAKVKEVEELLGYILIGRGDAAAALAQFDAVLRWIDGESCKAMPFVRVAARSQRRSVVTGRGVARTLLAEAGGEAALFGKALDDFVSVLQLHVDEKDLLAGKLTLEHAARCFAGQRDWRQAAVSAEKYVSWCARFDDAAGVAEGERRLAAAREKLKE